MERIEEKHNCLGYFGFGTGISLPVSKTAYCNGCFLSKACWEAHRARAKQGFPDLANHVDEIGTDKKAYSKFINEGGVDPYLTMMMGNIEDSMAITLTGKPKDRGQYTLKYPFE